MALETLVEVVTDASYATLALSRRLTRQHIPFDERPLATELVQGVLRQQGPIASALGKRLKKPLETLPLVVRVALQIGAYQLMFLRMPAHSAVDQAVALVPRRLGALVGMVNAVLRNLARELEHTPSNPSVYTSAQALASATALPLFLVDDVWRRLGSDEAHAFAEAQNERPPLSIRVNRRKISVEALTAAWVDRGLTPQPSAFFEEGLVLQAGGAVRELPGFSDGYFSVQDMAAAAVTHLAAVKSSDQVIDLCAAPGGKTTHVAELLGPNGHILACDKSEKRLRLLDENAARLGLSPSITPVALDSTDPDVVTEALRYAGLNPAQITTVILDAPCSGLGTLRRHPELRRRTLEEEAQLLTLQRQLLASAATLVPQGAALIYSVCTPIWNEGHGQVAQFLKDHPDFSIEPIEKNAPQLKALSKDGMTLETWPHRHGLDAFFAVRLIRQKITA